MAETPRKPTDKLEPAQQQGEEHGAIKQPQQTDATMTEKDLARGSEKPAHARK